MAITVLSRWSTDNGDDVKRIAGMAKSIMEGHGAEYVRLGQVYSGSYAGEWVVAMRFADWESYGKSMQAATNDPAFQDAYGQALSAGQLLGRSIITSVDI